MHILIISLTAFGASCLTFFSGFGLGTVLTPVFALFFPIELAVAMTAIVHFLNNLFKLGLVGRHADRRIIVRFGIPAIFSAFIGAWVLVQISDMAPVASYSIGSRTVQILLVKAIIGFLLVVFALFEIIPAFAKWQVSPKYLPLGGLLSGFFGGLSGNQGALRSVFLTRIGLSKESFIATGIVIACLIDVTRLSVYANHFVANQIFDNLYLLVAPTLSAFLGAYLGNRLLKRITMEAIPYVVAVALVLVGLALSAGLI